MACRGIIAGVSAVLISLAGCTLSTDSSSPDPGVPVNGPTSFIDPPSATGTTGPDRATVGPIGPTFPLTVRRTGGIAGFHDTIVLRANGTLTVDTDTIHGRTCALGNGKHNTLLVALSTLMLGTPSSEPEPLDSPSETGTDPITITVTDNHHRLVGLDDPSLGEVRSQVAALVADVTLTDPATTRCTLGPARPTG